MTDREAIKHLTNYWYIPLGGQFCVDDDLRRVFAEAIGKGISALQEREERSRGCEWCNRIGKTPENWECSLVGEYGTVTTADNEVLWTTADFCPKCGRRLKEAKM